MPLRACIDNQEIISVDLTDDEWNHLKLQLKTDQSSLTLPCCGGEGFLRTSSKGLKHFVHSKSARCDWKPESAEHLKAKVAILEACRECGWEAIPEYSEADWRADVLAIQGQKRIAFEVQWSRQSYEETQFRQSRYKASDVRGCWFFRIAPKEMVNYDKSLVADKDIPAFKIFKNEDSEIYVQFGERRIPLKTMVVSLLNRKLKFCEHTRIRPKQEITISFFEYDCWKCHKKQYCYAVTSPLKTVCGLDIDPCSSMWDNDDIDKNPQVYDAVQRFLKTEQGKEMRIGKLQPRFSKTVGHNYLSHGCYYCNAIFGDFFLQEEKFFAQDSPDSIRYTTTVELTPILQKNPHWCFSEDGYFCE